MSTIFTIILPDKEEGSSKDKTLNKLDVPATSYETVKQVTKSPGCIFTSIEQVNKFGTLGFGYTDSEKD